MLRCTPCARPWRYWRPLVILIVIHLLVIILHAPIIAPALAQVFTGSPSAVLGLQWLRYHDPLVNWNDGKLLFTRCPPGCGMPVWTPTELLQCLVPVSAGLLLDMPASTALPCSDFPRNSSTSSITSSLEGPDVEKIRSFEEACDGADDIDAEWFDILCADLGAEDGLLPCVDLHKRGAHNEHADPHKGRQGGTTEES